MTSLVKKSFQFGKAVYATVNDAVAHPENYKGNGQQPPKPQQQTYYPPTQIPGLYTAQGHIPPPLPPRPANTSPIPQAYEPNVYPHNAPSSVAGPVYGQTTPGAYPSSTSPVNHGHAQDGQWTGHIPAPPPSQSSFNNAPSPFPQPPPGHYTPHAQYSPTTPSSAQAQPFSSQANASFPHPPPPVSPLNSPPNTQVYAPPSVGAYSSPSPLNSPPTMQAFGLPSHGSYPSPAPSPAHLDSYTYGGLPQQPAISPHFHPAVPAHAPNPQYTLPQHYAEHPSAFIAELPGHMPSEPVELPAEMPANPPRKESTVIPMSSVTITQTVQEPTPIHPIGKSPDTAYVSYTAPPSGQNQSTSFTPSVSPYQSYHPAPSPQPDPSPISPSPGQYLPYHPPAQPQSSAQYSTHGGNHQTQYMLGIPSQSPRPSGSTPIPYHTPQPGMSNLAQKIQQMKVNKPEAQYPY